MTRAANMSYRDYVQIWQTIQKRISSKAPLVCVDVFCAEIASVIGRKITSHQIEHVLRDNSVKWREVFLPRTSAESGKQGGKRLAEVQEMLRSLDRSVRLLQMGVDEILQRLPPNTTVSSSSLFSEEHLSK